MIVCTFGLASAARAQEPRTSAGLRAKVEQLIAADSLLDQYTNVPDSVALRQYIQCTGDRKSCTMIGATLLRLVKVSRQVGDTTHISVLLYEPVDKLDGTGKQVGVTSLNWTMVYSGGKWNRVQMSSIVH
jgi:hypothetical protein